MNHAAVANTEKDKFTCMHLVAQNVQNLKNDDRFNYFMLAVDKCDLSILQVSKALRFHTFART